MFHEPNIHIVPTRRRNTKRFKLNGKIKDKLRENASLITRSNLDVKDINGAKMNKYLNAKMRDTMNMYKDVRGAKPKFTLPKKYNENNSFDYSDVNLSRRVIRKMVQSSLFDHKPYDRAKHLDNLVVGNKFISKVDPIKVEEPNKSVYSMMKSGSLNKSVDFSGNNYFKRSSRRQLSTYESNLNKSMNSLSPDKTGSFKDFRS